MPRDARFRADAPLTLQTGTGPAAKVVIRAFAEVPASGTTRKSLLHAFPQGGPAVVQVALPEDALADDDAQTLVVNVPREVRVLVVNGAPSPVRYRDEAYFVDAALASPASPIHARTVDAEGLPAEDLSKADVVFLLNVRSVGAKAADLARFVEEGGGLFVSVGDQVDPELYQRELGALLPMPLHVEKTAGEGRAARLVELAWDHPALSIFSGDAREGLLGVRTSRYLLAKPGPAARARDGAPKVLASFDDGAPALVEARRGKGRVLLFTSTADRDWTDWPIRTSFLPAMQRFAAYLAGAVDQRREAATVVGARRTLRLGEGEALVALMGPDGRERSRAELERGGLAEAGQDALELTPTLPGLWQVKVTQGGQERVEPRLAFAVAPDPREADTRRLEPSELTAWFGGASHARVEGLARTGGARELPLWSILLVLGLGAFFLEGVLIA